MKIAITSGWLERLRSALAQTPSLQELSDGRLVRYAAQQAAQNQLEPAFVDNPTDLTVNVSILSADTWFTEYKHHHRVIDQSQLLVAMANAYLVHHDNKYTSQRESDCDLLTLKGMDKRPQQRELAAFLSHTTAYKRFRICEASTGIGKGLAIVAAAINSKLAQPQRQVIIAAPTIALVDQLYNDYLLLANEHNLSLHAVKSQSSAEYLSLRLAQYWCDEFPEHPDREAFQQALALTNTYSIDAFREFTDIPLHELTVLHDTKTSDPGYQEFLENKEHLKQADLIVCTHSLLALSALHGRRSTKEHRLSWDDYQPLCDRHFAIHQERPSFYRLDNQRRIDADPDASAGFFAPAPIYFIDEAHLLNDMLALVATNSVSLNSLERAIMHYRGKHTNAIKAAINNLIHEIPQDANGTLPLRNSTYANLLHKHETNLKQAIDAFVKSKTKSRLEKSITGRNILRIAKTLQQFSAESHGVNLGVSPVRKYIRIESSASSHKAIIDHIVYASGSMSFTSATLHLPNASDPLNGYGYIARELGLPEKDVLTHSPLVSTWLNEGVSLFMAPDAPEFKPSSDTYLYNCGMELARIIKRAKGGTLVLCTSYDQILLLQQHLDSPRVIAQTQGQNTRHLINHYLELYQQGKRPVWLATGAVWTGVDISDKSVSAEDDLAIENLVVLKLPFEVKEEGVKASFFTQMARCFFRFKQGIGRLVRRPGRSGMNIYIMDGRANQPNGRFSMFHRYLTSTYKHYTLSARGIRAKA